MTGPAGPAGPAGEPGSSGIVETQYASANNLPSPSTVNQYLSPAVTVTIGEGEKISVSAGRALGSNHANGGDALSLWICHQNGGVLTTRPVKFKGKHLFVNVDSLRGSLRAEILEEDGRPIAPFTLDNCITLNVDETLCPVKWRRAGDLSALRGRSVRFRFHLVNVRLYSFWVSPDTCGASYGYVAGGGPRFTSNRDTVGRLQP